MKPTHSPHSWQPAILQRGKSMRQEPAFVRHDALMKTHSHRDSTCCTAQAMSAKDTAAAAPASVPSALTAPSVPRGTRCSVVMRYVVCPYAYLARDDLRMHDVPPGRLCSVQ